jgi:hypothetical protein
MENYKNGAAICALPKEKRGITISDYFFVLMIAIVLTITIGTSCFISGFCYRSYRDLNKSAYLGKVSTNTGVYYVKPIPDEKYVEQLEKDIVSLNKQLNDMKKKRRR